MKHWNYRIGLVVMIAIVGVFFGGFVGDVFAQTATTTATSSPASDINVIDLVGKVRFSAVGNIVNSVLYILITIVGALIKGAALLAGYALKFNQSILAFDPPLITNGWTLFRDFANLGFVFGIIVIAVSTILRFRSYGSQQVLFKLIAAALLVNFSLVLAGSVMNVADVFSNYFLRSIAGQSGEVSGVNSFSLDTFTKRLGDQFPIKELLSPSAPATTANSADEDEGSSIGSVATAAVVLFGAQQGLPAGSIAKLVDIFTHAPNIFEMVNMFVTLVIMIIVFFALLAFAAMLVLRYFWLSFLLMLSPIVWLLWVFPQTQKFWSQWWSKFLHWVMYAPTVLFFLWLSMTVLLDGQQYGESVSSIEFRNGSATIGTIQFGLVMQTLMAAFLLLGGMKAAQAMGHGGTTFALSATKSVGNWTKRKAGGLAARGTAWGLQKTDFQQGARALAEAAGKNRILKYAGVGAAARGLIRAGAGVQEKAGGEYATAVQEIKNKYKNKDDFLAAAGSFVTSPYRAAALSVAREKGWLDAETAQKIAGAGGARDLLNQKERFDRWGIGKDFGDVEKALGTSKEMMKLADALAEQEEGTDKYNEALKNLTEETRKFAEKLKGKEWENVVKGVILKKEPTAADTIMARVYAGAINSDPSGKRFSTAFSSLEKVDDMNAFLDALILQANSETPDGILGKDNNIQEELQKAKEKGGDYTTIIEGLEKIPNDKTTPNQKRLLSRLKKSVMGDIAEAKKGEETKPAEGTEKKPTAKETKPNDIGYV